MSTRTVLKQAGLIEYAVVRTPLQLVDERVVQRYLSEDSAVRRLFEQALGAYDQVAASWRSDPDTAAGPEGSAFDRVASEASDTVGTTERPAEDRPAHEPDAEQVEELADELIEEQETETFAGELAENDDLRHVQAELQAKRLLEEQGE